MDGANMGEQPAEDQGSWFPLALAGGFVALALLVAVVAYAANRHGDPSKASTVDDVAELAIEAVENADHELGGKLACGEAKVDVAWVGDDKADAAKSSVTGVATGSFRLSVEGRPELLVTVAQDGDRSCIESVQPG
jgi:hypothetical protein